MENQEKDTMTLAEAQELLQQVLMTLAKNSVHNKRLLEYADELERYIAVLEKEAQAPEQDSNDEQAE
jgi:predicted metal-dependent hydrolase